MPSLEDDSASSESDSPPPPQPRVSDSPKLSRKEKQRLKKKQKRQKKRKKEAGLEDMMENLAIEDSFTGPTDKANGTHGDSQVQNGVAHQNEHDASDTVAAKGEEAEALPPAPEESKALTPNSEYGDLASYDPPAEVSSSALADAAAAPYVSLRECFEAYCKKERLRVEDGNGFRCDKCPGADGTSDAWKRFALLECPRVLVVHLKRLLFGSKVNKKVNFERDFDAASFCMTPEGFVPSIPYQLAALIEHSGSASGGHYTAFVDLSRLRAADLAAEAEKYEGALDTPVSQGDENKEEDTNGEPSEAAAAIEADPSVATGVPPPVEAEAPVQPDWYYISDTSVQAVDESRVFRAQAYMLFYVRTEC
uniref:ubiquitinyl hydrolase 1 n=1 Tax=Phaeomonas parva TaxID=124430 RepID=A0A7S1XLE9_9STRA